MDFDLSDEQKILGDTVDRLLRAHVEPATQSVHLDEHPPPDAGLEGALAELGLVEALVDPELNQHGLDLLSLSVVAERLGRHAAPSCVVDNVLAAWVFARAGAAGLVQELAGGRKTAAFALSESSARILPADWELDPAAGHGEKPTVLWGGNADLLLVGLSGERLGLVDANASGVHRTPCGSLDRSRPVCDVVFDGADIAVLPLEADMVRALYDALLIVLAADAHGAGERATHTAVEYAKERRQFDRPIASFQAIKHQLANMAVEVMPNRPLVWYAAHLWDLRHADASRTASLVKAYVSDVSVRAARASVEIHGGIGYTWEYPLHVFVKRAMADRAIFGLPATHQQRAMGLAAADRFRW